MKKKAFTLIELIAVLVILAILALIVTPLVMNIIRKARISADKRSIDAYGRSVELAIAAHLLDTGTFPTDLNSLTIEYTGKEVSCNVMQMKENGGIYLSECTVGTKAIKDETTEDGWYHYGTRDLTNEEYVDMYGLSLKNASVAYYEANGNPVEDYRALNIDYKGKTVVCDVTVNYNGTIYMTKCKVNNVDVTSDTEDGFYHYGEYMPYKKYELGDNIIYNNVDYYVLSDSYSLNYVTLIKSLALTRSEILTYGINHINNYTTYGRNNVFDYDGYGGVAYYTSETCGWFNNSLVTSNCTNDYNNSDVKYIVDGWVNANVINEDLSIDKFGYSSRLLSIEDIGENFDLSDASYNNRTYSKEVRYEFLKNYGTNSGFWTMIAFEDNEHVIDAGSWYNLDQVYSLSTSPRVVRPVVNIKKSALN